MRKRISTSLATALLLALAVCVNCAPGPTPLDAYVQQPDVSYTWHRVSVTRLENGVTRTQVDMTSQTWHGIVWKHELDIFRPQKPRDGSTALLMIRGGRPDANTVSIAAQAAILTGMPTAILSDVPNQPLFGGLREDEIISYTFVQCLQSGDATWPLLFPMTKSAVRAMDTIQKITAQWTSPVKGFVVTGASKRGWTTWFTAAADKRVIGIAPAVYDNLNLPAQMRQQIACYGAYSMQIKDYTEKSLPQLLSTDKGKEFARLVDPYAFLTRLTVPKLLILGSNDPYWTLESANLYYGDLPGDKHIMYAPNTGHGALETPQGLQALASFAVLCSKHQKLPAVNWAYGYGPDGLHLTMRPVKTPTAVRIWTATSATRDFRKARWADRKIAAAEGAYTFTLTRPKTGYAAVFGEVSYPGGFAPLALSTTPRILAAK
jgi:PhoPQ-activated pathogenicity-related protein